MRPVTILLPLLLLLATGAQAQPSSGCAEAADTVRGLVGQEMRLPLRLARVDSLGGGRLRIEGDIRLDNPTVFLPERFVALPGDSIVESNITLVDTRFHMVRRFSLTLQTGGEARGGDTVVLLAGEALAGNDSCSLVTLDGVTIDGRSAAPRSVLVRTRSVGTPFPYIRFATLEPGVPNPSRRGDRVSFGFRIDKDSDVEFRIYALNGEQLYHRDLGYLEFGSYSFTFDVDFSVSSGPYLVRMSTNTGEDYQLFHVMK